MDATARLPDVTAEELAAAATNYVVGTKLLLENAHVRVWELTLESGERTPFHCHRTTYFYRCETGAAWRLRTIDGDVVYGEDGVGEVTFHELAAGETLVHEFTNVGNAPLRYTTVELVG